MKRRVQERGELDWSAEDLIELQSQPFEVIDAIYNVFGNIVVSGCDVVGNTIGSGVVMLDGKIMPFEESTVKAFPCYIDASITPINARYVDGLLKPISYEYKAIVVSEEPTDKGFITVASSGVDKLLKRSSDSINSDSSEMVATSKAVKIIADEIEKKANSEHTHNYEPVFSKKSAFNKDFGSLAGSVCQGNDSRLSDDRKPISHSHSDYQSKDDDRLHTLSKNIVEAINTLNSSSAAQGHTHDDRYELKFNKSSAFNKDFGSSSGTVCEGDDSRLSDAREASDVYSWAKSSTKPSYSASEVGAASTYHSHSGYESAFSKNSAFNKNFGSSTGTVCEGNDSRLSDARVASDVSQWAKYSTKPSYTASEVGAANTALSNVTLTKNLSGNGYYKAPDGLIIQWGSASGSGSTTVYYPTSFTTIYSVVCTPTTSSGEGAVISACPFNIGTSSFREKSRWTADGAGVGDSQGTFYWIAIGK